MNTDWKSKAEIDTVYQDHLQSLRLSGLPYSEREVFASWAEEVRLWRESQGLEP